MEEEARVEVSLEKSLENILEEMKEKMNSKDLSDEYLRNNNFSTREEIGIGEYSYGITMIPCEWVYKYLSRYKQLELENQALKNNQANCPVVNTSGFKCKLKEGED